MPERKLIATLRALHDGGVEFILVGGLAAVLQGAPIDTFDIDVVHSRDVANIARLQPVLEALDTVFRTSSRLASAGHLKLITRYGPLDLLDLGYRELLPHSVDVDIREGLRIRVLDLETLIALKEDLAGENERAVLPILRRTLEEKRKR